MLMLLYIFITYIDSTEMHAVLRAFYSFDLGFSACSMNSHNSAPKVYKELQEITRVKELYQAYVGTIWIMDPKPGTRLLLRFDLPSRIKKSIRLNDSEFFLEKIRENGTLSFFYKLYLNSII